MLHCERNVSVLPGLMGSTQHMFDPVKREKYPIVMGYEVFKAAIHGKCSPCGKG